MCRGAGLVNRHYQPQQVFAYTISGKWGYLEHDWVATAGDWVYEAPGESHTLVAYECDEPMRVTFNVTGPLIWLDENGEPNGTFDVFDYIALCREHYEERDRRGLHRRAVPVRMAGIMPVRADRAGAGLSRRRPAAASGRSGRPRRPSRSRR